MDHRYSMLFHKQFCCLPIHAVSSVSRVCAGAIGNGIYTAQNSKLFDSFRILDAIVGVKLIAKMFA